MIGKKRWDKLIENLEELERQAGGKLRTEPRLSKDGCPMLNFYPYKYPVPPCITRPRFGIYTAEESRWWGKLTPRTRISVTNRLIKWLKDRDLTTK